MLENLSDHTRKHKTASLRSAPLGRNDRLTNVIANVNRPIHQQKQKACKNDSTSQF